jgi:hypothetical protein
MQNLEINKRLCRLVEQRNRMLEKKNNNMGYKDLQNGQDPLHNTILSKFTQELTDEGEIKKFGKKDVHEMLEDFYGERMFKIHKKFPKQFLKILMRGSGAPGDPHRSSNETKKELVGLLFDTVFYVVCDVVT